MSDALTARLEPIFREVLGTHDLVLRDDLTAADVEAWDSLAHVNLMFAIEEEFGVEFNQDELSGLSDVGELKSALAKKGAG